jgi:hypothetical protein
VQRSIQIRLQDCRDRAHEEILRLPPATRNPATGVWLGPVFCPAVFRLLVFGLLVFLTLISPPGDPAARLSLRASLFGRRGDLSAVRSARLPPSYLLTPPKADVF